LIPFSLSPDLKRLPDHTGNHIENTLSPRTLSFCNYHQVIEFFDSSTSLGADHATFAIAQELIRMGPALSGKVVVDVGCGTGVLATIAALNGAQVIGTEIDSNAIALAHKTVQKNNVSVDLRMGSLCQPLDEDQNVDLFITNLPQKPVNKNIPLSICHAGGPEGDSLFKEALPEFVIRQPQKGQLLFFMHSLPHSRLLKKISEHYTLTILSWKLRWKSETESPVLWHFLKQRHKQKNSYLHIEDHNSALVACVWLCTRKSI